MVHRTVLYFLVIGIYHSTNPSQQNYIWSSLGRTVESLFFFHSLEQQLYTGSQVKNSSLLLYPQRAAFSLRGSNKGPQPFPLFILESHGVQDKQPRVPATSSMSQMQGFIEKESLAVRREHSRLLPRVLFLCETGSKKVPSRECLGGKGYPW